MYDGPALPKHIDLPLVLEIEFLMAIGAGKKTAPGISSKWTITELTIGTSRQSLSNFFNGLSSGETFVANLFELFLENETNSKKLSERLQDAKAIWVVSDKANRRGAVEEAKKKYDLPETREERQAVYIEWAQTLKAERMLLPKLADPIPKSELVRDLGLAGFVDLKNPVVRARGFKKFLSDEGLRYCARDDYADKIGAPAYLPSERALLEEIDAAAEPSAVLIYGPGGVGKTRLAHHLCRQSGADLALHCDSAADLATLKVLIATQEEMEHIILFLDYAENVANSVAFQSLVDEIDTTLGIRTTLVLCSRTSGLGTVRFVFRNFGMTEHQLASPYRGNAVSYEQWLVRRILKQHSLDEREDLVAMCHELPFLAAFACFLKTEHPALFEKQFGLIAGNPHFDTWARARIAALDHFGPRFKRRLAEIALALPFSEREHSITDDQEGLGDQVLQALEDDYWVEREGDSYFAIHDTLADVIVSEQVLGARKPTGRLVELLSTAIEKEYFRRALISVTRIADHPKFDQIDLVDLFARLASKHQIEIQQNAFDIVTSSFLQPNLLPELIESNTALCDGLDADYRAHALLTEAAAQLIRTRNRDDIQSNYPNFIALLAQASATSQPQILANLVRYDPSTYAGKAEQMMRRHSQDWENSFLLSAYLQCVGNLTRVSPHVVRWLDKYGNTPRAAFVIRDWFNAFNERHEQFRGSTAGKVSYDRMLEFLETWCGIHKNRKFSAGLLSILAEQTVGSETVIDWIQNWLEQFAATRDASRPLEVIIRHHEADRERALNFAIQWFSQPLEQRPIVHGAHVFKALRDVGCDFADFSELLLEYIQSDGATGYRRYLCECWLHWGGEPDTVKETLTKLIDEEPLDKFAAYSFGAWNKFAPDRGLHFQDAMKAWLVSNATLPDASYIFKIWFQLGIDAEPILPALRSWLKNNERSNLFPYLLTRFAQADPTGARDFEIRTEQLAELNDKTEFEKSDCMKIERILASPQAAEPDSDYRSTGIEIAFRYLSQYETDLGSAFLIAHVMHLAGYDRRSVRHTEIWIGEHAARGRANVVLQAMLAVVPKPTELEHRVSLWLDANTTHYHAGALLNAWVEAGGDPARFRSEAKTWARYVGNQEGSPFLEDVSGKYRVHGPK